MQFGPRRALDAVDRPENLRQAGQFDPFARAAAGMVGGKTAVIGRVPILRGHHQVEPGLDAVDDLDDPIAFGTGNAPPGQKSSARPR